MFLAQLKKANPSLKDAKARTWLYVPYDQLTDAWGPLARESPDALGIILIEAPAKAARRPYHKQKLALLLTNMRHFALEQAQRGVYVHYAIAKASYAEALREAARKLTVTELRMMIPAERELRVELAQLVESGLLHYVPHEGWLTTREDFGTAPGPWRMDAFYRRVRIRSGIMMRGGKPEGGKFSFDAENRLPWKGSPQAPQELTFEVDAITQEVCELIETRFAHHPGRLVPAALPATHADAEKVWEYAKKHCLPQFGPFEDAMSTGSRRLFHTNVSPLLNLGRLRAKRLVDEAAALTIPLASREGFVRQLLGWREFVKHVHDATDGFRTLPQHEAKISKDAGYTRWKGKPWPHSEAMEPGASISFHEHTTPLPPAFWGKRSGLACLDHVVQTVWEDAYSHHITRLMVLSNIATLLDVSPRELTDWFWVAYQDAYDWVVEPNVLGMGTYAAGDLMTTKPYISGAGYINKMSNYCEGCQFDPKKNCPLTRMYWAFLARHADHLTSNVRMSVPLAALRKRSREDQERDRVITERVQDALGNGIPVTLQDLQKT